MKKIHDEILSRYFKNFSDIKSRAMFGGYGLYKKGVIFGMIVDEDLYFKVDSTNLADYQAEKSEPFTYIGATGKPISMSYWKVPARVIKNAKTHTS